MQHVEIDEEMDMPCLCDCGNRFELNDGYGSLKPNKKGVAVCPECHFDENKWHKQIEDLRDEISDLEIQDNKKRQIKKLKLKLHELEENW